MSLLTDSSNSHFSETEVSVYDAGQHNIIDRANLRFRTCSHLEEKMLPHFCDHTIFIYCGIDGDKNTIRKELPFIVVCAP